MIQFYGINESETLLNEINIFDRQWIDVSFENIEKYNEIQMKWSQSGMSIISNIQVYPEFHNITICGGQFVDEPYLWIFEKRDCSLTFCLNKLKGTFRIRFYMNVVRNDDLAMIHALCQTEDKIKEKEVREELKESYNEIANSTFWKVTSVPRKITDHIREKDFSIPASLTGKSSKIIKEIIYISKDRRLFEENYKFEKDIQFSILVPLFNTPEKYLKQMIESVQNQTYKNWQLCLADASNDDGKVSQIVQKYKKYDERISYIKLNENLGISENTNACVKLATGNFISLLDHDDVLHPSALFKTAQIIQDKDADFIYTDEAIFLGDNLSKLKGVHYKPDYSPETLISSNYICHFVSFSKHLFDEYGGFHAEFDGAQDHDLFLHLTHKAKNVEHIAEVLYFWRSHKNSTADNIETKSYAIENGQKVVHRFLLEQNIGNEVRSTLANKTSYHILYEMKNEPKVSIIIPNKDHYDLIHNCVESILAKTIYENYEIVIVDNGSTNPNVHIYYDYLVKNCNKVKILHYDKPFNYAAMNNFAVSQVDGEHILLLNNDTEVISPMWINELVMYSSQDEIGAVGARLYYPTDTIQHAGVTIGTMKDSGPTHSFLNLNRNETGYMGRVQYTCNVLAVTAACLMVKKSIFEAVNGFDEKKFAVAYNDVDLCLKIYELGKRNIYNPFVELYHYESISRGLDDEPEKRERFLRELNGFREKWAHIIQKGDPFYNRNLSQDGQYHTPLEIL